MNWKGINNMEEYEKKSTLKIIDLLNKIANKEELPEFIRYDGKTYRYDKDSNDYLLVNVGDYFFGEIVEEYDMSDFINIEVEVVEPKLKIEGIIANPTPASDRLNSLFDELSAKSNLIEPLSLDIEDDYSLLNAEKKVSIKIDNTKYLLNKRETEFALKLNEVIEHINERERK